MNELRKIANCMLGICLSKLVQMKVVSREQVDGRWYSRCNMDSRLEGLGVAAAASIDDSGCPVVIFSSRLNIQGLAYALPHEAIHLAQICSGMSKPCYGYTLWDGKKYPNLAADDPNYFSAEHQPWEAQAYKLESVVREALLAQLSLVGGG